MGTRRGENLLYELSVALAAGGDHTTAIALRMLARQGYTTLDQVDAAPDWNLLAIPRMGVKRVMVVRRLTRRDWQPPRPQAIEAANWFLSAARLALRFWPLEMLESVIRGSETPACRGTPVERRLALDAFARAAHKARLHCDAEELVRVVRHLTGDPGGVAELDPRPFRNLGPSELQSPPLGNIPPAGRGTEADPDDKAGTESAHYAFPRQKRQEIVRQYRAAWQSGKIQNKEAWAQANFQISGRTLLAYEREFPETQP